jgi:hypothetical protein
MLRVDPNVFSGQGRLSKEPPVTIARSKEHCARKKKRVLKFDVVATEGNDSTVSLVGLPEFTSAIKELPIHLKHSLGVGACNV